MHPLSVGSIALPNPVLLAPMSGVTDAPFRRLVAAQGAGLVVAEMTAGAALAQGKRIVRPGARSPNAKILPSAGQTSPLVKHSARG